MEWIDVIADRVGLVGVGVAVLVGIGVLLIGAIGGADA